MKNAFLDNSMINARIFQACVFILAIGLVPAGAQSGQINGLSVQPLPAVAGHMLTITVNGTGICEYVTVEIVGPQGVILKRRASVPQNTGTQVGSLAGGFSNAIQPVAYPFPMQATWGSPTAGDYRVVATPAKFGCTGTASVSLKVFPSGGQFGVGGLGSITGNTKQIRPRSDLCKQGYVWREAGPEDHVCVTPGTRDQTRTDNNLAGRRAVPNSEVCKQGFVWREAFASDHVCVTSQTRTEAAYDNRFAAQRRAN